MYAYLFNDTKRNWRHLTAHRAEATDHPSITKKSTSKNNRFLRSVYPLSRHNGLRLSTFYRGRSTLCFLSWTYPLQKIGFERDRICFYSVGEVVINQGRPLINPYLLSFVTCPSASVKQCHSGQRSSATGRLSGSPTDLATVERAAEFFERVQKVGFQEWVTCTHVVSDKNRPVRETLPNRFLNSPLVIRSPRAPVHSACGSAPVCSHRSPVCKSKSQRNFRI